MVTGSYEPIVGVLEGSYEPIVQLRGQGSYEPIVIVGEGEGVNG